MKCIIIFICIVLLSCNTKSQKENIISKKEYILSEKDLVPEGIAYSKKKDAFYLTSVGKFKIIEVDRKTGKESNFINEHEFGYTPGAGIYVDDNRNLLHAIGGYYMIKDSLSSLFTFDLNTKKLLSRHSIEDGREHFLNDMVKDKTGNIYLTDSKDSSVYFLNYGSDSLELFYKSEEIEFPNGIAISSDNSKLYVASIPNGVRIMDISTKKILNDKDTVGQTQGIDGLEFYNDDLYGIQNSVWANSFNFRKLFLNQTQDSITNVKIIDSHTPKLNVPLTFCMMEDKAVVIGNSNLQYLNQETFKFQESDTILNTKLLVYEIE